MVFTLDSCYRMLGHVPKFWCENVKAVQIYQIYLQFAPDKLVS